MLHEVPCCYVPLTWSLVHRQFLFHPPFHCRWRPLTLLFPCCSLHLFSLPPSTALVGRSFYSLHLSLLGSSPSTPSPPLPLLSLSVSPSPSPPFLLVVLLLPFFLSLPLPPPFCEWSPFPCWWLLLLVLSLSHSCSHHVRNLQLRQHYPQFQFFDFLTVVDVLSATNCENGLVSEVLVS